MSSQPEEAGAAAAWSMATAAAEGGHSAAEIGDWLASAAPQVPQWDGVTMTSLHEHSQARQFAAGYTREAGLTEAGLSELEAADAAAEPEA